MDGLLIESYHSTIVVGDTVRMDVMRRDGSVPTPSEVRWSSSDPSVAIVGLVTGTGAGWAQIGARTAEFGVSLVLRIWDLAPPFVALAAGVNHTCGLDEEGRAWCWGWDDHGQLGTPTAPDWCEVAPETYFPCSIGAHPVSTDQRFVELAVGFYHSCGLTAGGTAYCWGWNQRGELGDGGTTTRATPAPVAGDHVFTSLVADSYGTCPSTRRRSTASGPSPPAAITRAA